MLSFSLSIAVAVHEHRSVPALPLLSLAFILPNIRAPAGRGGPALGAADAPGDDRERAPQRRRQARAAGALGERAGSRLGAPRSARQAGCGGRHRRRRQLRRRAAGADRRARGPRRPARPRSRRLPGRDRTHRGRCAHGSTRSRRTRAAGTPTGSRPGGLAGRVTQVPGPDWSPFGNGPYDVRSATTSSTPSSCTPDSATPASPTSRHPALTTYGPALTGLVVSRMHASAPDGVVVHIHDRSAGGAATSSRHARPRARGSRHSADDARRCCSRARAPRGRTRGTRSRRSGSRSCGPRSGGGRSAPAPTTWPARRWRRCLPVYAPDRNPTYINCGRPVYALPMRQPSAWVGCS